jgi:NADH:ubiquinone oxidoreductase subunit K
MGSIWQISLIFFLFFLGLCGMFLSRKHLIIILISLEILILSSIILFTYSSVIFDDLYGQIVSLFLLTVAASESAIGLALLVLFYRLRGGISIDLLILLKA